MSSGVHVYDNDGIVLLLNAVEINRRHKQTECIEICLMLFMEM
jgi:hypothetical protein